MAGNMGSADQKAQDQLDREHFDLHMILRGLAKNKLIDLHKNVFKDHIPKTRVFRRYPRLGKSNKSELIPWLDPWKLVLFACEHHETSVFSKDSGSGRLWVYTRFNNYVG